MPPDELTLEVLTKHATAASAAPAPRHELEELSPVQVRALVELEEWIRVHIFKVNSKTPTAPSPSDLKILVAMSRAFLDLAAIDAPFSKTETQAIANAGWSDPEREPHSVLGTADLASLVHMIDGADTYKDLLAYLIDLGKLIRTGDQNHPPTVRRIRQWAHHAVESLRRYYDDDENQWRPTEALVPLVHVAEILHFLGETLIDGGPQEWAQLTELRNRLPTRSVEFRRARMYSHVERYVEMARHYADLDDAEYLPRKCKEAWKYHLERLSPEFRDLDPEVFASFLMNAAKQGARRWETAAVCAALSLSVGAFGDTQAPEADETLSTARARVARSFLKVRKGSPSG